MTPRDRACLWAKSLEGRSVPSTGDVSSPAASSSIAPDLEDGARPVTVCLSNGGIACSEFGDRADGGLSLGDAQGNLADVTITNRTWSSREFTLSSGFYSHSYALRPAESISGRGLGGQRLTFYDGRGWSTLFLQSYQDYQFVELGGLFLLQKTL